MAKKAPFEIFLQGDPDDEELPFTDAEYVTWCAEQINDSDVRYVRADCMELLIELAANRVMRLGRDSASREEFIAAVMSEWRAAIAERDGKK